MHELGSLLLLAATAVCQPQAAVHWDEGLSDRELALGRWFSQLTFLQDCAAHPWPQWHDDKQQLGITSLRYQLAFAGYGCAAMAAKTPAYRELVGRQLLDLCQRMIDLRVWQYVGHYWKYGDAPPDPCLFENVMYTGHLTQLMCLYELLSGDFRYSTSGWDFVWRDGRKTHYDLRAAIERLHVQCAKNPHGGVCCEPNMLFAACNSHSANSFALYDLLHDAHYADVNQKWFAWMSRHFRIPSPSSPEFLYAVYRADVGLFLPVSDVGADGWTLGWSYPWLPDTAFAKEGWRRLLDKGQWRTPSSDESYIQNNFVVGCCGGGRLELSNCFVPLLAVQAEGRNSPTARKVLNWFERQCGRPVDADGDGYPEGYYYHTDDALSIAATGNIAAALATDGDSLRRLFRTSRRSLLTEPTVAHVDYPNVYVRAAEYRAPVLRFAALRGRPSFTGKTAIVCTQISPNAKLFRDGQPYDNFQQQASTVTIDTDLEREHVFELR